MHRILLLAAVAVCAAALASLATAGRPAAAWPAAEPWSSSEITLTSVSRKLAARLERALTVPRPGLTAAIAVDLRTGERLFERRRSLALAPASNEKLAVSYAALVALGPAYRIETTVLGDGELIDGVWHGDLILKGYGDPSLTSGDLRRLAGQLHAGGLRRVTGRIVGDESFFDARRTGPGWKPSYYIDESPPLSALTVDRARFHGVVTTEPARSAALAFRDALRRAGITVAGVAAVGEAPGDAFALGAVASPPMSTLVRWMNEESDNFIAELLLKQLGAVNAAPGTSARGAAVVRASLAAAGVPLAGVRIVDGSGLSPYNRITATSLAALLQAAWSDSVIRKAFIDSLPVAGRTGTLADRMRAPPARGRVAAKTGTTASASTLAGYVRGRFAFAVLSNGRPVNQYRARQAQDRFAGVLAGG